MSDVRSKKGFTLVEMIAVIAIMGILAAIAVPQLRLYRVRSFRAVAVSDAKCAYEAAMNWFAGNTCTQ